MSRYRYLFGPVPSRRFGRSLGIDLVPMKTCTENCVFCQLGATPTTSVDRRDYVPTADVLAELRHWARAGGEADIVTLSGSGEPTLHSHFGEVIRGARAATGRPTLLLTNGTLMGQAQVRQGAAAADIVKVSLSAWDAASFERINRPHASLVFDDILEGYRAFRSMFKGKMWVEVFMIDGVNTASDQVAALAALARSFSPDRIQLNTAVRPPTEAWVHPPAAADLARIAHVFSPHAEVVSSSSAGAEGSTSGASTILELITRHPATTQQLAHAQGREAAAVQAELDALKGAGKATTRALDGDTYYLAAERGD